VSSEVPVKATYEGKKPDEPHNGRPREHRTKLKTDLGIGEFTVQLISCDHYPSNHRDEDCYERCRDSNKNASDVKHRVAVPQAFCTGPTFVANFDRADTLICNNKELRSDRPLGRFDGPTSIERSFRS